MELENFGCVAMDATEMVNVDGGADLGDVVDAIFEWLKDIFMPKL